MLAGAAGVYTDRASTAPWTRPSSEFVAPFGMFTAAEFALMARRHMHRYGTTPERWPTVAATIRNNGHVNPEARSTTGAARSPPQDILDSRMVADPFHLLDCAMTSEGGCGLVLTRADLAADLPRPAGLRARRQRRQLRPAYKNPPTWDLGGHRRPDLVERLRRPARRARTASAPSGLGPDRRRRVRVLRPVLVRDHPPVRGVRLLRRGRGRRLRDERHHRARWPATRSRPTAA